MLTTDYGRVAAAYLARAPEKFAEGLAGGNTVVQLNTLEAISKWLVSAPKNKVAQVRLTSPGYSSHSRLDARQPASRILRCNARCGAGEGGCGGVGDTACDARPAP